MHSLECSSHLTMACALDVLLRVWFCTPSLRQLVAFQHIVCVFSILVYHDTMICSSISSCFVVIFPSFHLLFFNPRKRICVYAFFRISTHFNPFCFGGVLFMSSVFPLYVCIFGATFFTQLQDGQLGAAAMGCVVRGALKKRTREM